MHELTSDIYSHGAYIRVLVTMATRQLIVARLQAGSTFGWEKHIGSKGIAIGVDTFGASAPGPVLYENFGITPQAVADAINKF